MQSLLVDQIITVTDRDNVISILEKIGYAKFGNSEIPIDEIIKSEMPLSLAKALNSDIQKNQGDIGRYLTDLRKFIDTIDLVKLTLAYEPDTNSTAKIYQILANSIGRKILIDYKVDPMIVAGVIIEYKGKYKDFSLKKIFEQSLEQNRGEMLKQIANSKHTTNN